MNKLTTLVLLAVGLMAVMVACGTETGPTSTPPPVSTPASILTSTATPTPTPGPVEREVEEIFRDVPPLDPELVDSEITIEQVEEVMRHVRDHFPELGVRTEHASMITPHTGWTAEERRPDFGIQIWSPPSREKYLEWQEEIAEQFRTYFGPYLCKLDIWWAPVISEVRDAIAELGLSEKDLRTPGCEEGEEDGEKERG